MYLLDSNVFIEAKNRYYAFDIAPGFWEWLESAQRAGDVCSIEEVLAELTAGSDLLSDWAHDHASLFRAMDAEASRCFSRISTWAASQQYTPAAVATFLSSADYFLVAYALAHGHTLVTHEISNPNSRARVMIPDACQALGVDHCGTFTMLRETGVTLLLK